MREEEIITLITERIKSEHRKHKDIEWEQIASHKIYASLIKLLNLHSVIGSYPISGKCSNPKMQQVVLNLDTKEAHTIEGEYIGRGYFVDGIIHIDL